MVVLSPPRGRRGILLVLYIFVASVTNIFTPLSCCWAYENCTVELGGGICPDGNTCCRMADGSSGCIASDMGKYNATCCSDRPTLSTTKNNNRSSSFPPRPTTATRGGCGVGYQCRPIEGDCIATDQSPLADQLVHILPRYHLCQAEDIRHVYGLPVPSNTTATTTTTTTETVATTTAQLAYYSSHGPIENLSSSSSSFHSMIDFVLIVIHGTNRNADDYFCAATAAVQLQTRYQNVLVVAPRFLGQSDIMATREQQQQQQHHHQQQEDSSSFLYWKDDGAGPWRYGANAMGPVPISSYTALDTLVATILQQLQLVPSYIVTTTNPRITMAGHSSGGQMMQRWSLLTSTWDKSRMRAIVANPSSYAYLTPLRYINETWQLPQQALLLDDDKHDDCPQYNQWEWGLDLGGPLVVPYRQNVDYNASQLVARFQDRSVIYLSGSLDRCNISDKGGGGTDGGWCHSHGLETSCMDRLQGSNRWERSVRYLSSLRLVGIWNNKHHRRVVVRGVGHDHSLMFQSPEGIAALFGGEDPQSQPSSPNLAKKHYTEDSAPRSSQSIDTL